jgi:DNA mismatch repair protein MutS2
VLCTTHYDRLKALGQSGPPFYNASVGYDLDRLAPTYRLHLGIPGASSALSVASRLGLPAPIIDRARDLLQPTQGGLDALLQALGSERERAMHLSRQAEELRLEAQRQAERAAELRAQAQAALARARQQAHDEAIDALRGARRELLEARSALRAQAQRTRAETSGKDGASTQQELQRLQRRVDELSHSIAEQAPQKTGPAGHTPTPQEIPIGTKVYVPRLGGIGTVMSDAMRDKVVVQVGALRLSVELDELVLPSAAVQADPKVAQSLAPSPSLPPPIPPRTPDATLDLRGERAHVAIARAEKFLDDALRESRPAVFILHGHGTGALLKAIRSHFTSFPGVRRMRPAEPNDGGDGVTVLELDT